MSVFDLLNLVHCLLFHTSRTTEHLSFRKNFPREVGWMNTCNLMSQQHRPTQERWRFCKSWELSLGSPSISKATWRGSFRNRNRSLPLTDCKLMMCAKKGKKTKASLLFKEALFSSSKEQNVLFISIGWLWPVSGFSSFKESCQLHGETVSAPHMPKPASGDGKQACLWPTLERLQVQAHKLKTLKA